MADEPTSSAVTARQRSPPPAPLRPPARPGTTGDRPVLTTRPMSRRRPAAAAVTVFALAVLALTASCSSAGPPSAVSTPTPARTTDMSATATTPPITTTAPIPPTASAATPVSPPTSTPTRRPPSPTTPSPSRNPVVIITPPSASKLDLAALRTVEDYAVLRDSSLTLRSSARFEQLFSQKCAKCLRDLKMVRSRIDKGWYFVNLNGTSGPKNVVVSINSSSAEKVVVKLELAEQPNRLIDRAGKVIGVNKGEQYYLYYAKVVRDDSDRAVISMLTLVDRA